MEVKANGQLAHHFWGEYFATIALGFANTTEAYLAQKTLGTDWKLGKKSSTALVWHGNREQLNALKKVLGSFGADLKKIDSIAKSIDYGEPFTVTIPVTDPNQMNLF